MVHLGKTIKLVRGKHKLSVRAAAIKLGISHVHLVNIENNHAVPSLALLDRFRSVFHVDLAVLAWCLFGEARRLPESVRAPMKALANAWRQELEKIPVKCQ